MFRRIRIRAESAHFCPYNTPFHADFGRPSFSKYQKFTETLPFIMVSYADQHYSLPSLGSYLVKQDTSGEEDSWSIDVISQVGGPHSELKSFQKELTSGNSR